MTRTCLPILRITPAILFAFMLCITACKKNAVTEVTTPKQPEAENSKLSYGSSVFYIKSEAYTVLPGARKAGTYTAFPNTLKINSTNGEITVSQKGTDGESQTGLRYKITYQSDANETDSTFIVIGGISYIDRFYDLSQNDSIIYPIYNGNPSAALPAGNYNMAGDNKFAVNATNGQINIKECIRRGYFSNQMSMNWKQQTIKYSINDNSNSIINSLDVIIYYYNTMNDVPSNVSKLMQAHKLLSVDVNTALIPATIGAVDNNLSSSLSALKPRPPCIIIVGH